MRHFSAFGTRICEKKFVRSVVIFGRISVDEKNISTSTENWTCRYLFKRKTSMLRRSALVAIKRQAQGQAIMHSIIDDRQPMTMTATTTNSPSFLLILLCLLASTHSLHIPVLFESHEILAVHKPSGIPHHSNVDELGIVALLRQQYTETRLYSVHRLDRVTSGILLLAKTPHAAKELTRLFREKKIVKYYTALSFHKASQKKQGWVQGGMERGRRKSWKLVREVKTNYARTRFFSAGLGHLNARNEESQVPVDADTTPAAPRTLLLLRPYTGKTHQLRVAAKSVGLPLAGDPIYKDRYDSSATLNRTFLHATALEIVVDANSCFNQNISLWCSPPFEHFWKDPQDFDRVLQKLVDKHCESSEIRALCCDAYHKNDAETETKVYNSFNRLQWRQFSCYGRLVSWCIITPYEFLILRCDVQPERRGRR